MSPYFRNFTYRGEPVATNLPEIRSRSMRLILNQCVRMVQKFRKDPKHSNRCVDIPIGRYGDTSQLFSSLVANNNVYANHVGIDPKGWRLLPLGHDHLTQRKQLRVLLGAYTFTIAFYRVKQVRAVIVLDTRIATTEWSFNGLPQTLSALGFADNDVVYQWLWVLYENAVNGVSDNGWFYSQPFDIQAKLHYLYLKLRREKHVIEVSDRRGGVCPKTNKQLQLVTYQLLWLEGAENFEVDLKLVGYIER